MGDVWRYDDRPIPRLDYVIEICEGTYKEWKLTSQSYRRRELKGASNENTVITVVRDSESEYVYPLFYISADTSNSTLSLSKITFLMSVSHSLVLIESSDCISIMEDLKISCVEGITLGDSLIKTEGNSFIKKCKFYDILLKCNEDGSDGYGGVFHITIDNLNTVEFDDHCLFENCEVNTKDISNGGALYVNLKKGYFYVNGQTSFTNCFSTSSKTEEGKGYIFFYLFIYLFIYFLSNFIFLFISYLTLFIYLFIYLCMLIMQ
jgi:hypothetical protein